MPSSSERRAESITSRSFAVRRKGFDPDEVRAYLGQLTEVISRLTSERDGARVEAEVLRSEAEARPEIDEDQLTAVLGEETARVLSSARKAAVEMKERAEESVARMLRDAAAEAGDLRRQAEADAARVRDDAATVRLEADEARRAAVEQSEATGVRIRAEAEAEAEATRSAGEEQQAAASAAAAEMGAAAEAEAETTQAAADAVLSERTAEAEQVAAGIREGGEADAAASRSQAEADAAAIAAAAESAREARHAEGREMVAEAQRVRERMLADLSRRRKAARVQLEQLQAGRDRLLESYEGVQREIDAATTGLRGALPEARAAAEAARVRAEAEPADSIDHLEAEIAAARSAGLPLVVSDENASHIESGAEAGAEAAVDLTDGAASENVQVEPVDLTDPLDSGPDTDVVDDASVDDAGHHLSEGPVAAEADDDGPPSGGPGRNEDADTEPDGATDAGPDPAAPAAGPHPDAVVAGVDTDTDRAHPTTGPDSAADADSADMSGRVGAPAGSDPGATAAGAISEGETQDAPTDDAPVVAGGSDEEDDDHGDPLEQVDDLFARLRASRTESVDHPRAVFGEDPDQAGSVEADSPPEPPPASDAHPEAEPLPSDPEPDATDHEGGDQSALVSLLEQRDGAVEPIENRVARRLKRVLADEQGRVLEGVRRTKGPSGLDEILPLEEQMLAYAAAVVDDLLAAAEEGASFEGAALPSTASIDAVAEDLGRSVAAMVRPRVERCFDAGDDADDTSDRLRATYREWKTDALVEATRHHILAAFGSGQCAVRPVGSPVRWVSDPAQSACPDCEDDALAGAVPSGERFPTGHTHPPAHPGCRCIVIGERVGAPA